MVNDPYRRYALKYDTFVEPFNSVIRQIVIKSFPVKEGMKVLDVGCGTGTNLMLYHKAGCLVHGIDLSPSMLEVARNKLGEHADLRVGDASQMPYQDNFFDLVTSMLTLHEIPYRIRSQVMKEMIRVVSREGRILLTDYHPGPIRFPKGWMFKAIILLFEVVAGREHFKNYRDFLKKKGLPELIGAFKLVVETKKMISGGNIALFIMKPV
ncbi:MAG: methyltransferase domain-containing protein [Deltaproteobacteria bacterium]|nr:methyltransferase domain-containing protein [Deltaproteobacteria bacterium]MBM4322428.1 methyltransferase domain-containing protein [Deltaproteobacteria bacterium]